MRRWRIPLGCDEDKALAQAVVQGEEFPLQETMKGVLSLSGWSRSPRWAEWDEMTSGSIASPPQRRAAAASPGAGAAWGPEGGLSGASSRGAVGTRAPASAASGASPL